MFTCLRLLCSRLIYGTIAYIIKICIKTKTKSNKITFYYNIYLNYTTILISMIQHLYWGVIVSRPAYTLKIRYHNKGSFLTFRGAACYPLPPWVKCFKVHNWKMFARSLKYSYIAVSRIKICAKVLGWGGGVSYFSADLYKVTQFSSDLFCNW